MELDARLAGYLRTNRDFMAPVVEQGVGSLGLAPGSVVMDAGTGAGGALPVLARAVGPEGHVTAVDLDPTRRWSTWPASTPSPPDSARSSTSAPATSGTSSLLPPTAAGTPSGPRTSCGRTTSTTLRHWSR